jgi:hypothetical protein
MMQARPGMAREGHATLVEKDRRAACRYTGYDQLCTMNSAGKAG